MFCDLCKDDIYVDDLAEETGILFSRWAEQGVDMDKAVTKYMNSSIRKQMDERHAWFATMMCNEQNDYFDFKPEGKVYSIDMCEWVGYFYTYLQSYTKESSANIIRKFSFDNMLIRARGLHDLDMSLAIKKVLNNSL